jgi:hypothetical protein
LAPGPDLQQQHHPTDGTHSYFIHLPPTLCNIILATDSAIKQNVKGEKGIFVFCGVESTPGRLAEKDCYSQHLCHQGLQDAEKGKYRWQGMQGTRETSLRNCVKYTVMIQVLGM